MPCQMAAVTSESRNLLLGIFSFQVPEPAQTLCLSEAAALLSSLALGQVVLALPTGFFGRELGKSLLGSSDRAESGVKSTPYFPNVQVS